MRCFVDLQDSALAALIFLLDAAEDGFAGRGRTHQRRILAGNVEVGFGQRDFRVIDKNAKERPMLIHLAKQDQSLGAVIVHELVDGEAQAVPCGQKVTRLGPGENPGDGAEAGEIVRARSPAGSGAESNPLDEIDGRTLTKVPSKFRSLLDEMAIEPSAASGQFLRISLPLAPAGCPESRGFEEVRI